MLHNHPQRPITHSHPELDPSSFDGSAPKHPPEYGQLTPRVRVLLPSTHVLYELHTPTFHMHVDVSVHEFIIELSGVTPPHPPYPPGHVTVRVRVLFPSPH